MLSPSALANVPIFYENGTMVTQIWRVYAFCKFHSARSWKSLFMTYMYRLNELINRVAT